MSTMPPISSFGSAPLMTLSSPAFSTSAIQSRISLLATSELPAFLAPAGDGRTFLAHPCHADNWLAPCGNLPGAGRIDAPAQGSLAAAHHDDFEPIDRQIHQRRHDRQNGDRGHHDVHLEDLAA